MLAYDKAVDEIDIEIQVGEIMVMNTMVQFGRIAVKMFGLEHLREPTVQDTEKLLAIGAARGFPGMLASVDCMH